MRETRKLERIDGKRPVPPQRKYRVRRGAVAGFIALFFWLPTMWLLRQAWLSRNGDYCDARVGTMCLARPAYQDHYITIGLIYLAVAGFTTWYMLLRKR